MLDNPDDNILCFTLLDNERAAVGTLFGVYLYDIRSGKQVREFLGHNGIVNDVELKCAPEIGQKNGGAYATRTHALAGCFSFQRLSYSAGVR